MDTPTPEGSGGLDVSVVSFALCHGTTWLDKLIRFGERIRSAPKDARWSHAAVVMPDGSLIEALSHGVQRGSLAAYPDHALLSFGCTKAQAEAAYAFAESCLGDEYGYLTDLSIGLDLLTPAFIHFKSGDTLICSELVARTLEHAGWISPKLDTSHVMPSDLAAYFDCSVKAPAR